MANYESEHTKFMREWMAKNPNEAKEQAKGRALWWDSAPLDLDELRRVEVSKVATKSYYYDVH